MKHHHRHHHHAQHHNKGISLQEKLEQEKNATTSGACADDHSHSLRSGYTADPTERSISSSVCLSETGQIIVATRVVNNVTHETKMMLPPPPPFREGDDAEEEDEDAMVHHVPRNPKSFRRRSMFGSTPMSTAQASGSTDGTAPSTDNSFDSTSGGDGKNSESIENTIVHKKSSKPRRRSLFGSTPSDDVAMAHHHHQQHGPEHDHHPSATTNHLDAHLEKSSKKHRRRSFFGSGKSNNSVSSHDSHSNSSTGNSTHSGGLKKTRNMVSAFLHSHAPSHRNHDKQNHHRGRRYSMGGGGGGGGERQPVHGETHETGLTLHAKDEAAVPAPAEHKASRSRRRHSLFGNVIGGSKKNTPHEEQNEAPPASPRPQTPGARRRRSLFGNGGGGFAHEENHHDGNAPPTSHHQESKTRRRHSLLGSSPTATAAITPSTTPSESLPANPYKLLNEERTQRNLHPYMRSMLLDSIAKGVALQLARSLGTKCRPTDYYGNVGKGLNVRAIHQKMMAQKGTEKANIISSNFYHVGIGMSRGRDGQLYLCQLFQ